VPRAALHVRGVTLDVATTHAASAGVAPPSSLIPAHASDQNPPVDLALAYTTGLCRLSPVPARSWPFPALSLQTLHRNSAPCPVALSQCVCSFLPGKHRPRHCRHEARLAKRSLQCNFNRGKISGLQAFRYVRVPVLASPPGCTHRWSSEPLRAARTFTPRNGHVVTHANCGIATRLNRAIGATGLSPARVFS
jgi:hypothetical protein